MLAGDREIFFSEEATGKFTYVNNPSLTVLQVNPINPFGVSSKRAVVGSRKALVYNYSSEMKFIREEVLNDHDWALRQGNLRKGAINV